MTAFTVGNSFLVPSPSTFGVHTTDDRRHNENNNDHAMVDGNGKIQEIWNKHIFQAEKVEQALSHNDIRVSSWISDNISNTRDDPAEEKPMEEQVIEDEPHSVSMETTKEDQNGSPSHHARRPMNAFLIFCKKHRPIVRDRFPNLENRGVTKILGEWWSLLEEDDKMPFTNLANEYKDAFLSANPDFKWYKLPAPPLRSLLVRPSNTLPKVPSPQSSPSHTSLQIFNEFTPGKLADESQLGSLTTLMNNNYSCSGSKLVDCCEERNDGNMKSTNPVGENNNEIDHCDISLQNPVNLMETAILPPKPLKKRKIPQFSYSNTKEATLYNLNSEVNEKNNYFQSEHQMKAGDNMTNQDIFDKIVDNFFIDDSDKMNGSNFMDQDKTRKSGRQCKGKRYEKFMVEGKLLGNKRDARLTQNKPSDVSREASFEMQVPERKLESTTPNLENTIKRLAERTKLSIVQNEDDDLLFSDQKDEKEECCSSEASEPSPSSNFNLDLKITNLPSLSYDAFVQKKRESKKRKMRKVSSENSKNRVKMEKNEELLVGSKKRKNKRSITHLEKNENKTDFNDLLGLATLAEVAANTQKIKEN